MTIGADSSCAARFKSLAVWPHTSYSARLCFDCLTYKSGTPVTAVTPTSQGRREGSQLIRVQVLAEFLLPDKC